MVTASGVISPLTVGRLIGELRERGYRVVGPTIRDGAIVYADVEGLEDLPIGWTDEQEAASYRLRQRDDGALFGYAVGPHSWKRQLLPPRQLLWTATRESDTRFRVTEPPRMDEPMAFLGVRACDLAAIAVQDRILVQGAISDTVYATRRENVVVVAVNCGEPGGTCFCASMGTGPAVGDGADLVITELLDASGHDLLVEARSDIGRDLLDALESRPADASDHERARGVTERAANRMGRTLDAGGVHDLLLDNLEHPRWDDVAERCLTCGNCTLVCPTCFCTQVEDVTDLSGTSATRERRWDSCFTLEFSHAGPASVRTSARSRYRQWMTHKLATWVDQFDTSGCVGCGRCITWCPVGIDITKETAAIAAEPQVVSM